MIEKSKYSILYAEDNVNAREHTVKYLELFFGKIYEASDGIEALDIYNKYKPDVIISDISMPNMDGMAFVKEVRKTDIKTPIIMLTAYSAVDTLKEAVSLKLEDYIVKPMNRSTFNKLIQKVIVDLDAKKEPLETNSNNEILEHCEKELNDLKKASIVIKAFQKQENTKEQQEFNRLVDLISTNVDHISRTITGKGKVSQLG